VFVCDAIRALKVAFAGQGLGDEVELVGGAVDVGPAPLTLKTPALYVAEPASAGAPMSASVQGTGSGGGGATTVRLTVVAWVAEGAVPVTLRL